MGEETGRGFEGAFRAEEEGTERDFVGVVDVGTGETAGALTCMRWFTSEGEG